ncbi:MAG: Shedu anti-phage system protein SduA domain-containing protein, partial [Panacagrimonas sp.]
MAAEASVEPLRGRQGRYILIVGDLAQLRGHDRHLKTASFEEFRRHLVSPELVTFDELLAKARFMVASAAV